MWTPIVESMQLVRLLVAPTATRAQYQHLHWSFEACVKWILPDRQARVLPEVRVMPPSARPTASETVVSSRWRRSHGSPRLEVAPQRAPQRRAPPSAGLVALKPHLECQIFIDRV